MDASGAPVFKTGLGDLWVENGLICLKIDLPSLDAEVMRENLEHLKNLDSRSLLVPAPVLVDLGSLREIDRPARECAASLLNPRWNERVALVFHDDVQHVIASFFKASRTLEVPIAIAGSREEATAMLNGTRGPAAGPGSGEPAGRLDAVVEAAASMASGNFDVDIDIPDGRDGVAAFACGLRMLAEEMESLIARRKRAEAELLTLNRKLSEEVAERERIGLELEKANTELNMFAHTVSHDLKGPLSAIGASARLVIHMNSMPNNAELESNIDELLWMVVRNVEKADRLIEDTLVLAEAGQVPQDVRAVDISSVVSRVLRERSALIEERSIAVEVDGDLGSVVADPTHMYQLFSNLISNAVEHNSNPLPRICLSRLDTGGECRKYQVRDNGEGIAPGEIENLFKPFVRSGAGSTGIGLSIVDRIARVYGGEVSVRNDGGACFEVSIHDFR